MMAAAPLSQHLTAADDRLHAPPNRDDPMWTESYYFAFDLEERALSMAAYPLFRPNLGIWSLAFHLWDASGVAPWEQPYSKFLWHLPLAPDADLTDFEQAGLRYKTLAPLQRYHVGYHDPGRVALELEFDGLDQPFASWTQVDAHSQIAGKGHFDQDCRVTGELVLNGERIRIDTFGHRDRSWYSRPDTGARRSASNSYGVSVAEQFLVMLPRTVGSDADPEEGVGGYMVRDGVRANVRSVRRRVTERIETRPQRFELEAVDDLGRMLTATGRANSTLAFNTSPPIFCWFSQVRWETATGTMIGEDQETYAYGEIGALMRAARG